MGELKIKIKTSYLIAIVIVLIFLAFSIFLFQNLNLFKESEITNVNDLILQSDIILGNPNSGKILIEYSSLECSACEYFHLYLFDNIQDAINKNEIAYIIRLIPFKRDEFSNNLAKLGYCSIKLTNSTEFIKTIYKNLDSAKNINFFYELFDGDVEKLKECVNSFEAEKYLSNNIKKFLDDKNEFTPTFILIKNGRIEKIVGARIINLD